MTRIDGPDPDRLGGLAWTRRTGGRLTRRERARLLAAIGRGQWENVLGRTKLALGWLPPGAANVDLDTFAVPIPASRVRLRKRAPSSRPV